MHYRKTGYSSKKLFPLRTDVSHLLTLESNTVITDQDRINKDSSVTINNDKKSPRSQPFYSPKEPSANGKATDSGTNKEDGRNDPNQESEISKETAGSNKQDTGFGANDTVTNTNSKECESVSKRNEPQYRTSNRLKKKSLCKKC